jgi:ribulose-5-phosphate 4-epimerase/fuculose-1-phosphate aldolase
MAKTCVHHKETPAATMCHQCHAPICTACSIVTPRGTFCSPECGILFRDFKDRQSSEKEDKAYSKMTTLIKLVAALLLMGLGFVGINQAAEHGMPQLRRIDVIGRILDLLKSH